MALELIRCDIERMRVLTTATGNLTALPGCLLLAGAIHTHQRTGYLRLELRFRDAENGALYGESKGHPIQRVDVSGPVICLVYVAAPVHCQRVALLDSK